MTDEIKDEEIVLSPEEMEQLNREYEQQEDLDERDRINFPMQQEQSGIVGFLHKVLRTKNTTKVGNLDQNELISVRALIDGATYAEAKGFDLITKYFTNKSETILATSDSKDGFLLKTAVTQKKQLEASSKQEGGYKGWKIG
jgi:hypothetical protein